MSLCFFYISVLSLHSAVLKTVALVAQYEFEAVKREKGAWQTDSSYSDVNSWTVKSCGNSFVGDASAGVVQGCNNNKVVDTLIKVYTEDAYNATCTRTAPVNMDTRALAVVVMCFGLLFVSSVHTQGKSFWMVSLLQYCCVLVEIEAKFMTRRHMSHSRELNHHMAWCYIDTSVCRCSSVLSHCDGDYTWRFVLQVLPVRLILTPIP